MFERFLTLYEYRAHSIINYLMAGNTLTNQRQEHIILFIN